MNYEQVLNTKIQNIKPSGIRKFFDLLEEMDDAISGVQSGIDEMDAKISEMSKGAEEMSEAIAGIQSGIDEMDGQISDMEAGISGIGYSTFS